MGMGAARVPRLSAGLPSAAPPRTGGTGTERTLPRRPQTTAPQTLAGAIPRSRVRSAPAGDSLRVRGQDSRPRRRRRSPPATTCPRPPRMSPDVRSAPSRAVGPDHEWGTHTDRPFAAPPAAGTPSSQQPRAGHLQKQAAPHLRCGAAGVAAPVHARCSLSGEDCSRHPPNTPTSARGHRTSSFGGILLPDPPS